MLASLSVKSRDNARTPMQWDDRSHASFTEGIPWLPVNPNYVIVNARAAVDDPDSVFHHYRRLIELRHTSSTVVEGRFALLLPEHEALWAFTRTSAEATLLVLANLSSGELELPVADLPDLTGASLLLGTHADSDPVGPALAPWESRILQLA